MVTDHSEKDAPRIKHFVDEMALRDNWELRTREATHIEVDYTAVPIDRLSRVSPPGIDVSYYGGVWMMASHDKIAKGFNDSQTGVQHARGISIDCTEFNAALSAFVHAMKRVEECVGKELRETHSKHTLSL